MDHASFILASYAVTALVFAALVVWLLVDDRVQKARLAALEKAGVSRRGSRKPKA